MNKKLLLIFPILCFSQTQIDWRQIRNAPTVGTAGYNFSYSSGSGRITGMSSGSGGQTLTFAPCPPGVNGSDASHYLYIAGTGTPEAALITGGTCSSGAAQGTVTLSTLYAHGAGYTIGSATGGIQEAATANPIALLNLPLGTINTYATITLPGTSSGITGSGGSAAVAGSIISPQFATGNVIYTLNNGGYNLSNFNIVGAVPQTSGSYFYADATGGLGGFRNISGVTFDGCYICVTATGGFTVSNSFFYYYGEGTRVGLKNGSTIVAGGLWMTDTYSYCLGVHVSSPCNSGIHIVAQDGGAINGGFIGGANYAGLNLDPNLLPYSVIESTVNGLYVDGADNFGIICQPNGTYTCNNWTFSGIHLNSGYAVAIQVGANTASWTVTGSRLGFGTYGGGYGVVISGASFLNFTGNNIYPAAPASTAAAIDINSSGTPHDISLVGNQIGQGFDTASSIPAYGILLGNSSAYNITVAANQMYGTIPVGILNVPASGLQISANNGVDTVAQGVASATTISSPISPYSPTAIITGTTTVTTISGGWVGRKLTFIKTDSGSLTIGGGGNVPASHSLSQNGSLSLTYNGSNWY